MSQIGSVGFWSYTRRDDHLEGGRILRLAGKIQSEYELITGEELKLFIDKGAVEWGDEWRRVTDAALVETAFFIPLITPKYLQSEECRREFIEFVGRAANADAKELVLPILYIDTPAVNDPDTSDEVARLVQETQRVDWRELRLASEESEEYRTAVNEMAQRLAKITRDMSERPISDLAEDESDGQNATLDDMAEAEEAILSWGSILEQLAGEMNGLKPLTERTTAELRESDRRGGGTRGRIRVLAEFANELQPPAERIFELGSQFARTAVDASPGVTAAISIAKAALDDPEEAEGARKFIATVQGLVDMSEEVAGSVREFVRQVEMVESVSRVVRSPLRRLRSGLAAILDALTVLDGWARLANDHSNPS
ncbi:TIR domain-containing protein [Micromonospora echinospora]|uniref:TIR domain-containing protein n=1 Tax=Micromonospora echinospora TaxID=1877 RepID=UPI003A8521D5